MKKRFKFAAISALLALLLGATHAHAFIGGTNVSQVANIVLTGFKQAGESNAVPVRITTKDIVAALNASGNFHFGTSARLLLISNDDQLPTAAIREGTGGNTTTTDISDFLAISEPAEVNANNAQTSYALRIFAFDNHSGTTFTVSGLGTLRRGALASRTIGPLMRVRTSVMEQVSGEGTVGGTAAILRGSIIAASPAAEVD